MRCTILAREPADTAVFRVVAVDFCPFWHSFKGIDLDLLGRIPWRVYAVDF